MVLCCFPRSCPFCQVSVDNGFRIVHEDDHLIAFHDRSPGAKVHLLIIPRAHITTVKALDNSHVPLLEKMMDLGRKLLSDQGFKPDDDTQARFGFHVPPFNSINHLHMHVQGLPYKNTLRKWKYTRGCPWYAEASHVLERLRQGLEAL
ncbi:HIT-like domain-containing protein [Zychaea mexicana]|uniref:HIT-like domain-containing protein n=1 Tax=Zychaea mexicana TaxID=64656 RepID=UPI0022FEB9BC|nr:HIT-like domain-containing protein [Zychaea mexicana]KAI9493566.1 HIT-like domain-containing protein [Zychaea mexicana]